MVELPDGTHLRLDVPGPHPDAPTAVLLHALGCTAYLTWFGMLARAVAHPPRGRIRPALARPRHPVTEVPDRRLRRRRGRVLDHLGIDTAIVAGYSLGGAVAQEMWHRHPERVSGLVLASTARNLRGHVGERMFFPVMTLAMHPLSRVALTKVERVAAGLPEPAVGRRQRRGRLGPRGVPQHLGVVDARGAGRARPLPLGTVDRLVDVPTAVVVTGRDQAIPTRRQRKLAAAIPDASRLRRPGRPRLGRARPRALVAGVPRGRRGRDRPGAGPAAGGLVS